MGPPRCTHGSSRPHLQVPPGAPTGSVDRTPGYIVLHPGVPSTDPRLRDVAPAGPAGSTSRSAPSHHNFLPSDPRHLRKKRTGPPKTAPLAPPQLVRVLQGS